LRLPSLTPEDISFRTLSLDGQGNLVIQGYAKNNSDISDLQARMIRSPGFEDIDLKFSTKRRLANMPVMDFKIASKLTAGGEGAL